MGYSICKSQELIHLLCAMDVRHRSRADMREDEGQRPASSRLAGNMCFFGCFIRHACFFFSLGTSTLYIKAQHEFSSRKFTRAPQHQHPQRLDHIIMSAVPELIPIFAEQFAAHAGSAAGTLAVEYVGQKIGAVLQWANSLSHRGWSRLLRMRHTRHGFQLPQ